MILQAVQQLVHTVELLSKYQQHMGTPYGHQNAIVTYLTYCKEHKLNFNLQLKAIK
jgi:hypothetical protein